MRKTHRRLHLRFAIAALAALLITAGLAVLTPQAATADTGTCTGGPLCPVSDNSSFLCPDGTIAWNSACPTIAPTLAVPSTAKPGDAVPIGGMNWPTGAVTLVLYNWQGVEVARTGNPLTVGQDGKLPAGTTLTVPAGAATGTFSVTGEAKGVPTTGSYPIIVLDDTHPDQLSFAEGTIPDSRARYASWFLPIAVSPSGDLVPISATGPSCETRDVPGSADIREVVMTSGTGACTLTARSGEDEIHKVVHAAKRTQTLSFSSDSLPASKVYGGTFTPTATSDVGPAPQITTAGGCTIADSGVVTMTSGTTACTVTASQDDPDYQATQVSATVAATKVASTTRVTVKPAKSTWGRHHLVRAHVSAGADPGGRVRFTAGSWTRRARVNANGVAKVALPLRLRVGKHTVTATYTGSSNAKASAVARARVRIRKAKVRVREAFPARTSHHKRLRALVHARIVGSRVKPHGVVRIFKGKRVVGRARLHKGQAKVRLQRLPRGRQHLRIRIAGNHDVRPAVKRFVIRVR